METSGSRRAHVLADLIMTSGRLINPFNEERVIQEALAGQYRTGADDGRANIKTPESTAFAGSFLIGDETITGAPSLVDRILNGAISARASDIHLEPQENCCRVRYRVDGALQDVGRVPETLVLPVLSRIKVMCDMDIAEKRRPQDARFSFSAEGRTVDVRVSSMPTGSGEKLVLRLLDQTALSLELGQLGLSTTDLAEFEKAITKPQGIVLVTGPTGSGKTTTLYAALKRIHHPRLNIVTIEDPIEYNLEGINQSQVKPDINYTFANALRAFLRQDPNVIMVGEIRDPETVQIALRAAMTGHLVLSTVHTNDAATTVTRLLDLGAEPYMVASSLSLILAQRLVRRLCPNCRTPDPDGDPGTFQAVGCAQCLDSGYHGRMGVFELVPIDEKTRELIHNRAPAERIRETSRAGGMRPLHESARDQWLAGVTTQDEIRREIASFA